MFVRVYDMTCGGGRDYICILYNYYKYSHVLFSICSFPRNNTTYTWLIKIPNRDASSSYYTVWYDMIMCRIRVTITTASMCGFFSVIVNIFFLPIINSTLHVRFCFMYPQKIKRWNLLPTRRSMYWINEDWQKKEFIFFHMKDKICPFDICCADALCWLINETNVYLI